jgi:rod shape-determining protein MreC
MRFHRRLKRGPSIGLVVVFFLFASVILRNPLTRLLHFAIRPLSSSSSWVNEKSDLLQRIRTLSLDEMAEIEINRIKLNVLEAKNASLLRENISLREELHFLDGRSIRPLGANILSWKRSVNESRFVVDRGTRDGVRVDMAVMVDDGVYVGKVIKVHEHQSLIATVVDREHITAVSMVNRAETVGSLQGFNGRLAVLKFIPTDIEIMQDDLIVTSGIEELIPPDLVVGLVNAVEDDPNGPFQQAVVEPISPLERYTHVLLLLPLEL